ncbi:hypothetical protein [uncultured Corynebacterium sp.]|uniref:hypothetical protein n=1 Tax=uncultured Corynebacterium sp. TaxID=159447 RepID=UPI0025F731C2|nr:hypothetical protein [uncultured Corynebacterium sp.]
MVILVAAGAWLAPLPHDWTPNDPEAGGGARNEASSRNGTDDGADPEITLTSLGAAAGEAMGERDFTGLADPDLAAACLDEHGESIDAILGAAPMAHGDRVGQLFVLSTGIPGRVTVLLTVNACGREPAEPVVHRAIGAPG